MFHHMTRIEPGNDTRFFFFVFLKRVVFVKLLHATITFFFRLPSACNSGFGLGREMSGCGEILKLEMLFSRV